MRAELERLLAAQRAAAQGSLDLWESHGDPYDHVAADEANRVAGELERILTRSDWIPASERLPPEGKLRLVQVLNLSDPDDMCCAYLWRGDWLMQTPDDMPDAIVHGVIAWQGLPAPYRAEGGGT